MNVRAHSIRIALTVVFIAVVTVARPAEAAKHIEIGSGSSPSGGARVAVAILHPLSPAVGVTANAEWGQRPWIRGERDRRLGYLGAGTRLRLFPHERIGNYATLGVGIGRLGFPGASSPGEWHAVPWTGLGAEIRLGGQVFLGAEARIEWLRRRGSVDGELPLRIALRLPLGKPAGSGR